MKERKQGRKITCMFSCASLNPTVCQLILNWPRISKPGKYIFTGAMEITYPPNSIGLGNDRGSWYLYRPEKQILNHQDYSRAGKEFYPNQSRHDFGEEQVLRIEDLGSSTSSERSRSKDTDVFPCTDGVAGVPNESTWGFVESKEPNKPENIKYDQGIFWPWVSQSKVTSISACSNDQSPNLVIHRTRQYIPETTTAWNSWKLAVGIVLSESPPRSDCRFWFTKLLWSEYGCRYHYCQEILYTSP